VATVWKIWTRTRSNPRWRDAIHGDDPGFVRREDAESKAGLLRSPRQEVVVLPEGQHPDDALQTTRAGKEIRVPTRGEFDDLVRKVAPPAGRKRPAETDEPRERSD
jgi:hypothetical protein